MSHTLTAEYPGCCTRCDRPYAKGARIVATNRGEYVCAGCWVGEHE